VRRRSTAASALAALGLVAALPAVGAGADAAAVLKSLEQAGRSLRDMKASFVETKVFTLLDDQEESRGEVFLEVPGRFRWNYVSPQPSVTLVRDGRFERYIPKTRQVFRGQAKGESDLLVGFGPGASGLDQKYVVTLQGDEAVGAIETHVLDLEPRPGQSRLFSAIRLWVDAGRFIPVQTRLTEPTGDYTTVRFENVVINGGLPDDTFRLSLPKGVVEEK
jgi:outer membrane lipoprotein carrier protein